MIVLVLGASLLGKWPCLAQPCMPILNLTSSPGAGFPILAKRIKWLKIPPRVFFISKHFGTGVLVATAFVHVSRCSRSPSFLSTHMAIIY